MQYKRRNDRDDGNESLKKKIQRVKLNLKRLTPEESKNKKNLKIKIMSNTLNYRDLAYNSVKGLDYDEMLELQAETGLSIRQIEFMYYRANH